MATEQAAMSLNGTYAAHQGQAYGAADQNYASHNATAAYSGPQQPASTSQSTSSNGAADIPKDEVGWYFVEQYYTTLSRTPEKLFLFYNKRSQFVSGIEEEKVEVCVGQKAINDRIKELDFKDCKVRVTNVDSQGSDSNIVIQVVGEISNKNQPHRKFCQTFVLAAQTNGYFVLNDIFRYIKEEDEELPEEEVAQEPVDVPAGYQEPAPSAQEPVVAAEAPTHETVANEEEVAQVDNKLEEIQKEETERTVSPPPAQVNGTPVPETAEVAQAEEAPAAAVGTAEVPTPEQAATEVAEEATAQAEKPEDPTPTPAPEPAKAAPAPTPAAPTKPMSWAMKAASANKSVAPAVPAVPAVPAQTTAPKAAPAQTKSAPAAAPAAAAAAAAAAAPAARSESPADNQQDGWQTAEHTKRQSRVQSQPSETTSVRAYIKNVYENIDAEALKSLLSKFDKIPYFDVSRAKNAAFVEFATQEGFNAAVAANPHSIGGTTIYVEERRQGGQFQRYPSRGGSVSRGRGGSDNRPGQGRGGFSKDGGRGGFTPRGRGGASTPRRGGSGAA